jgi:ElaB/YqjD/DUF883 family membrane-anchored ribosome-binding protein
MSMKAILALATLALVTLVLEDKARQVAGEAQDAYGDAAVQAREATESLRHHVGQQPLVALAIAGACGYVLSLLVPRRHGAIG